MSLRTKLNAEEFSGLDDATASLYIEGGDTDTYLLDLEADEHERGLKNALDRTREELRTINGHLKTIREIDPDPTRARELYDAANARAATGFQGVSSPEELNAVLARNQAAADAEIARITSEHEEEVAPLNAKLLAMRTEGALETAMADAGVCAPKLLLPHLLEHVRAEIAPKGVRLTIVDADGLARIHANGEAMTVTDLLREMQTLDVSLSRCFNEPVAMQVALQASQHARNGKATH